VPSLPKRGSRKIVRPIEKTVSAVPVHQQTILATVTFQNGAISTSRYSGEDKRSSVNLQTSTTDNFISMVGEINTFGNIYVFNMKEQGEGTWYFFENGCILRLERIQ